jgi:molybdenum cofactor biosynthesis enzyme MoaA/GNAT superfamily N-acetyltransferase
MSWQLIPTHDQEAALELYNRVFNEPLPSSELERRSDHRVHMFLVREGNQPPVGFGIFTGQGDTVDFWHGGVVPESRQRGAGNALLQEAERRLAELGYQRMTVTTYNRWNIMLSMLTRRGYRIVGTELSAKRKDRKIRLQRELRRRRELRLSLTEQCNFRCFFCHNEGLGLERNTNEAPDDAMVEVLNKALAQGCNDLTFTGGEPLLRRERLRTLLQHLARARPLPDVTVVTNGYRLDGETVAFLCRYPGKLKVHVSLHAADEETFRRVTLFKTAGGFERVKENIRCATAAGLTVKVNHVVLQGYNHEASQIAGAIDMARSLGTSAIKLLELLVIEDNAALFGSYYGAGAINRVVARHLGTPGERVNPRQQRYLHPQDTRFSVEVQQLTCQLGCSQCRLVRDRTISSDLRYHPCFIRTKEAFEITPEADLASIFEDGDRLIDGFACKYGDSSPTLLRRDRFIEGKRDVFFAIDDPDAFCDFLGQQGFRLSSRAMFHEVYFRPRHRGEDWDRFQRVLKIGWDSHDQSGVDLVYSDHDYRPLESGVVETTTRFLFPTGPIRLDSGDEARRLLDRLDFEPFHDQDWDIKFLARGPQEVSVAVMGERSTVRVGGGAEALAPYTEVFERYPGRLEPLDRPLVEWVIGGTSG